MNGASVVCSVATVLMLFAMMRPCDRMQTAVVACASCILGLAGGSLASIYLGVCDGCVPSLGTIAAFALVGVGGYFYAIGAVHSTRLCFVAAGVVGVVAIIGHVAGMPRLYFQIPNRSAEMALRTATMFVAVALLGEFCGVRTCGSGEQTTEQA